MPAWFDGDEQLVRLFLARPVQTSTLAALLLGALVLTALAYRRRQGLPAGVRLGLATLRLAALSLLVLVLFEPAATVEVTRSEPRRLAVLIDVSESMGVVDQRKRSEDLGEAAAALGLLPRPWEEQEVVQQATALGTRQRDAITAASRLDLVRTLVTEPLRPLLDELGEDLDVRYYAFGETLRRLGSDDGGDRSALEALTADQGGTSIAAALEEVVKREHDTPLAGIVLLSDGIDTSSRLVEDAVRALGARGIPVHTVPVGTQDPDDVSIRGVVMQDVAFTGDKVPVRVQLQSKGYEKRTADLTVRLDGRSVARRSVTLAGGVQFEEVFFNVDVAEKGAARVEVEVQALADEATEANNRVERSVRVVNERINVLCIEGSARWEFRYLRAMLKRDPRINATFIATRAQPELAQSSAEYLAEFPEERDEAFGYDLVILGDVDAGFFSTQALQRLEELVGERGGSLLMLCGPRFAPASYAGTLLDPLLPVDFDPEAPWEDVDGGVHPVLTPEGRSSLVMTLEPDQDENDVVWSRVAPLDRVPPLLGPRSGATVLAELSDTRSRAERYPLVTWQRYGTGKCMVVATDRLWLLRFKTGDKYHWRVWSQCIQFLTLSRLMGEHRRIRLETDRASYPIDRQVRLYANLLDEDYQPITQPAFVVEVSELGSGDARQPGRQQPVTLRPDAATPGLYEGYFSPSGAGTYRVEANESDRSLANVTEFQVTDLRPELASTDLQLERLRRIADLSGGTCLRVLDLERLPTLLDRSPHTTRVRLDRPLWSNAWVASLLVLLLGIEWILRRRYDLT